MKGDSFGDRMKAYESLETGRTFMPLLPVYARIDGRGFSKFTRGMGRPYDDRITQAMIATTKELVSQTHAIVGYTQSDEISLLWCQSEYKSSYFFDGKIQKMVSVLAGLATAAFMREVSQFPQDSDKYFNRLPHFDCRVYQLPNTEEAANVFLWREKDATKNAISMASRSYYSHSELHGKSSKERQEMLFAKGVNFNDYPSAFKRGSFIRKQQVPWTPTPQEQESLKGHSSLPTTRSKVSVIHMPNFSLVSNRADVLLHGHDPIMYSELAIV